MEEGGLGVEEEALLGGGRGGVWGCGCVGVGEGVGEGWGEGGGVGVSGKRITKSCVYNFHKQFCYTSLRSEQTTNRLHAAPRLEHSKNGCPCILIKHMILANYSTTTKQLLHT